MKKEARTLLYFLICFAPAAAMFALTLEWARPAAPTIPRAGVAARSAADLPYTVSFSGTSNAPPRETADWATMRARQPSVIVVDIDGALRTIYPEGESDRDTTPLTDILTRRIAAATPRTDPFQDRMTRSGLVALGLGLVTLTGGIGLSLFQKRMQGQA